MKKTILLIIMIVLAACTIKPSTPIPAIDPVIFGKESENISVPMSHAFMFVYDENSGFIYKDFYDKDDIYDHRELDCGWVIFKSYRRDISHDLFISVKPNETGKERSLTMMFENVWNTQHSGKSSITVIQKGK